MSTEWHQRWDQGRTRFHVEEVHSDLLEFKENFLGKDIHRVLVPLCGKSVDMIWLADQGHEVVGIELVPRAVEAFFQEQGLAATREEKGPLTIYSAGKIRIICGDIFDVGAEHVGSCDRVWDRAAMVALPPQVRGPYCQHLKTLSTRDALLLLNVFDYEASVMDGPPYSISREEVAEHYQACAIELVAERDEIARQQAFKDLGHTYWIVRSFLITLG